MFLSLQVIIIIAYFHDLKGRIKKLVHVRVCVYVCVCVCVCVFDYNGTCIYHVPEQKSISSFNHTSA